MARLNQSDLNFRLDTHELLPNIDLLAKMGTLHLDSSSPDEHSRPRDDEEALTLQADWSKEEEAKAKRK